ncbi:MBL fold metallo-hydrolase [Dermabacteraceae bacterium P7074]
MKIRHHRHSCMTVTLAGKRVLIDPGNLADPNVGHRTGIDAILITHAHPDHADPDFIDDLLLRNKRIPIYAEPEAALKLSKAGRNIEPIRPGQVITLDGGVEILAVGGRHAQIHRDLEPIGNIGFVLTAPGEPRLGVTGDSLHPQSEWTGVDLLAAPVAAPWSSLQETIDFLRASHPKRYLPVHDAILSKAGRRIFVEQIKNAVEPRTSVVEWNEQGTLQVKHDFESLDF